MLHNPSTWFKNAFSISALLQLEQPKEKSFHELQHFRTNSWGWKHRGRGSRTQGEISQKHITTKEWSTQSLIPQRCSCHPSSGSGLVIVKKKTTQIQLKDKTLLKFRSAHAVMEGVFPQESGRMCLQLCSPNNRSLLILISGRDSAGRTLQAAACKSQQLETEANYFKNREGSRRSACEDQDKVTDKSKYFHIQDKFL